MSLEWDSRNGRARFSIYSDDMLGRFDKLSGEFNSRTRDAMIVHEDNWTGQRRIIIAQEALVWEDDHYVYVQTRGRSVSGTESIDRPYEPPGRTRRSIPVTIY
jgi:hypothetical protein